MKEFYTEEETDALAEKILSIIKSNKGKEDKNSEVLALSGDLGAGKTSLVKAIAKSLGVEETVTSPTFVILKRYNTKTEHFKSLVHIDAYRIEDLEELKGIRFEELLKEENTLIAIEWPEKIISVIPKKCFHFQIKQKDNGRIITKND